MDDKMKYKYYVYPDLCRKKIFLHDIGAEVKKT